MVPTPTQTPPPPPLSSTEGSLPGVSQLARRIHGWSWQAFPIGMGTGAVYTTLSALKWHSRWLEHVETVFFFINLTLFILNTSTLFLQALLYPRQARRLLTDPNKSIFVPLVVLSFATIIIGTINYAVPHHIVSPDAVYVLFWIYIFLAVFVCFGMLMIWFNQPHDIRTFTPAWAFLVFPMMLVGVVAFNVLRVIEPSDTRAVGVLVVGYFFQGIGFFVTLFYIGIYILRLALSTGFLDGHQANGAFVACGPPGFTALALITLGARAQKILPLHGLVSPLAGEIWYATSVLSALLLFGFAVFLFIFGVLPYWFKLHKNLSEILGCWALTFPNVGWISTLRGLGDALHIPAFHYIHAVMTTIMCATWVILFTLTALAFYRGKIFFAKPEDVLQDEQAVFTRVREKRAANFEGSDATV
ncbi:hypothetical protein FA95DRAFT_1493955 [Auriscalpium vulgare]|uniref:Uncharacterized protein n=1 Tax=Auriscalpium vulgare TaxID=40419 RepID=A0ACB8RS99_9AGAM|nr:hypothetical protein FA95DRAFT_1493955 [Auriscalpium vulgare]